MHLDTRPLDIQFLEFIPYKCIPRSPVHKCSDDLGLWLCELWLRLCEHWPLDDPVAKPAPLLFGGILESVARLREHMDADEPEPAGREACAVSEVPGWWVEWRLSSRAPAN